MESMRNHAASLESTSATAHSAASAALSMNIKLQSATLKSQSRLLDLKLAQLSSSEYRELLEIVHPYVLKDWIEAGDEEGVNVYLTMKRMSGKAEALVELVAGMYGLPDALEADKVDETLVGICEMRSRISNLSALCRRFAAVLKRSPAQTFLSLGARLAPDLPSIEKRLDFHLETLRKGELSEAACASDTSRAVAQLEHLAESCLFSPQEFDGDLGEREVGYATSLERDLEVFEAVVGLARSSIMGVLGDEDVAVDEAGLDAEEDLLVPLKGLIEQCKTTRALSRYVFSPAALVVNPLTHGLFSEN